MPFRSLTPRAPTLLAAGSLVLLLGGAASLWRGEGFPDRRPAPARIAAAPAPLCVTRHGVCPTAPAPAGAPCGCPHALRGITPGRVGWLGDATPAADEDADAPAWAEPAAGP
jgi:hypothetical protein